MDKISTAEPLRIMAGEIWLSGIDKNWKVNFLRPENPNTLGSVLEQTKQVRKQSIIMEDKLFGKQEVFAIEVKGFNAKKQKGKIRIWVNGNKLGDLKRTGELIYAANAFKLMLYKDQDLYDRAFDSMSVEEIFSYCLFLGKKVEDFSPEDFELFQKMQTLSQYFGDQLDNVAHVIYCKDGFYHFLWSYNNDYSGSEIDYLKNLESSTVPVNEVKDVILLFLKDLGF